MLRSAVETGHLVRGEVVAQPQEAHGMAVAARVHGGVREELGDQVGPYGVVLQLAAGVPARAEAAAVPGVSATGGGQPAGNLAPAALRLPDYYGHNLDALNDCLGDVACHGGYDDSPEGTGLVLSFTDYDRFATACPRAVQIVLDIIADQARHAALLQRRF